MSRHETEPGIRATHSVTFLPWEIRAIREAASTAGVSVTRWLHDVAVTASEDAPSQDAEPAPVTITVSVDAHKLTDADWTRLINRLQVRNRTSLSQMRY